MAYSAHRRLKHIENMYLFEPSNLFEVEVYRITIGIYKYSREIPEYLCIPYPLFSMGQDLNEKESYSQPYPQKFY